MRLIPPTYTTCLLSRCHSKNNCRGEPAVIALSRSSWPSSSSSLSSSSSSSSQTTTTVSPTRVESTSRKLKRNKRGPDSSGVECHQRFCNGRRQRPTVFARRFEPRLRTWHVCHRETGALDRGKGLSRLFLVLSRHPAVNSGDRGTTVACPYRGTSYVERSHS